MVASGYGVATFICPSRGKLALRVLMPAVLAVLSAALAVKVPQPKFATETSAV